MDATVEAIIERLRQKVLAKRRPWWQIEREFKRDRDRKAVVTLPHVQFLEPVDEPA